jgi:hypothetical protein
LRQGTKSNGPNTAKGNSKGGALETRRNRNVAVRGLLAGKESDMKVYIYHVYFDVLIKNNLGTHIYQNSCLYQTGKIISDSNEFDDLRKTCVKYANGIPYPFGIDDIIIKSLTFLHEM